MMKPNERISLHDFYQLHGKHLYGDNWSNYTVYFLNSKSPTLIGFDLSSDAMDALMNQGKHLNKMAVDNAKKIEDHFRKYLDKIFFSDNFRTSYEYHGELEYYDFLESEYKDKQGKHLCLITLKPSSEFIDQNSIQLFNQNVSKTLKNNNKALLVSRAVLIHFDYFGIPANYKLLISKIQDEYQAVYGNSVRTKLVYDAISVMANYWNERPKN